MGNEEVSQKTEFSNFKYNCATPPTMCPSVAMNLPTEDLLDIPKIRRKHFLKFFLDTSYYLCVIPYKIVSTGDGLYIKRSFIFQKLLCMAVHFAATMDILSDLRSVPFGEVSSNPKMYFKIFMITLHAAVITGFCYSMWKHWEHFCWLVKILELCPVISLWYPKKINWIMSLVTVMYVIMALLSPLYNVGDIHSWEDLFEYHVARGRYMLFFSSESISLKWGYQSNQSVEITPTAMNASNYFFRLPRILFALSSYLGVLSQWLVVYHADLFVNVMALTLWSATSHFIHTLKEQVCTAALHNYEALKKLTGHINGAAGTVVLAYTGDSILFYATNLESMFTGKQWFAKVVVLQFLLSAMAWLHFASVACLNMDKFREWIRQKENADAVPSASKSISLMLLLDEISTHTVGLSGNGLFTVNYKFVAQAVTTVMTYFILVIQFK